jgi:TetR/AcrR family transcriptional repressor of nem operon
MPWSPDHKSRTRDAIVAAASRLFRRHGFGAVGVDTLMGEAGLTRGGFYAHFRDKTELFSDAIERAFDESEQNLLEGPLAELEGDAWLEAASARYLSMRHRDRPEDGCAVPSLGSEVARAPRGVRRTLAARLGRIRERIAERLGGGPEARRRALVVLSSWVGAMVLARAVEDRALAEEILEAGRESLRPRSGPARRAV